MAEQGRYLDRPLRLSHLMKKGLSAVYLSKINYYRTKPATNVRKLSQGNWGS